MNVLVFALLLGQSGVETRLNGRVTDSITHQPVVDADLSYCCAHYGSAKTDIGGFWSMRIVPDEDEGTVTATKAGYAPASAKMRRTLPKSLDFELIPAAHLSGRIVDRETRAPLSGTVVHARSKSLEFVSKASAEDGSFTIAAPLSPGAFILQIDPPVGRHQGDIGYSRTWYPGVSREELAAPVVLSAGENRTLTLELEQKPLHHLSGILDAAEHQTLTVAVMSDPPHPRHVADMTVMGRSPFRVDALAPGGYSLLAYTKDAEGRPAAYAAYRFEITDHSIEGLRLPMRPGLTVKAAVAITESGASVPDDIVFIAAPFLPTRVPPREQPPLAAEGLPPGEYWPILRVPPGFAVTSVLFNDRPADRTTVDLQAPASTIRFTLTSRPGSVTGTVRDQSQNAMPDVTVVLLPALLPEIFERFDPRAVRSAETGANGEFGIPDLAPGKYRAFALTGTDREYARDLPFLKGRIASAEAIELDFGRHATVELRVK